MVDILNFTVAKILDEWLSPSGLEYRCELEPLWLAVELVEKAKMGRVHPELQEWSYTGKPSRNVEGKKEEAFTNVSVLSRVTFNLRSRPYVGSPPILATQHDESSNLSFPFPEAKFIRVFPGLTQPVAGQLRPFLGASALPGQAKLVMGRGQPIKM
jgi:hypothetical protein